MKINKKLNDVSRVYTHIQCKHTHTHKHTHTLSMLKMNLLACWQSELRTSRKKGHPQDPSAVSVTAT